MTRSLVFQPLSSSQHEEVSQPDLHHPVCSVRLLTPPLLLARSPCLGILLARGVWNQCSVSSFCHPYFSQPIQEGVQTVPRHPSAVQCSESPFRLKATRWSGPGRQEIIPLPLFPGSQAQPMSSGGPYTFLCHHCSEANRRHNLFLGAVQRHGFLFFIIHRKSAKTPSQKIQRHTLF